MATCCSTYLHILEERRGPESVLGFPDTMEKIFHVYMCAPKYMCTACLWKNGYTVRCRVYWLIMVLFHGRENVPSLLIFI